MKINTIPWAYTMLLERITTAETLDVVFDPIHMSRYLFVILLKWCNINPDDTIS
jgi:hypothetical protein